MSKADKRKQRLQRKGIKIVKSALLEQSDKRDSTSIDSTTSLNLKKSPTLNEDFSPLKSNQ